MGGIGKMSIKTFEQVKEESRDYVKARSKWNDSSEEVKALYEVAAGIINAINKFEGEESFFTGFNIFVARCERRTEVLEGFLGV